MKEVQEEVDKAREKRFLKERGESSNAHGLILLPGTKPYGHVALYSICYCIRLLCKQTQGSVDKHSLHF